MRTLALVAVLQLALKQCFVGFVLAAGVVLGTVLSFSAREDKSTALGIGCIAVNILMYAAPLNAFRSAIRERSTEYVPLVLSLATLMNAIIWLAYALVVHDVNILVPNASGVVLGITQLGLYAWLRCLAGSGQTSGLGYTALADGEEVL